MNQDLHFMIRHFSLTIFSLLISIFFFSSCQKIFIDTDVANTPQNNFNYLWNDIKNRYSYLDYTYVDWNNVYDTLSP